jgi:hypothetical protein
MGLECEVSGGIMKGGSRSGPNEQRSGDWAMNGEERSEGSGPFTVESQS